MCLSKIYRHHVLLGVIFSATVGVSTAQETPSTLQPVPVPVPVSSAPVLPALSVLPAAASKPQTAVSTPKATALPLPLNLQWRDLTENQRGILRPLAIMWDSLEDARKRKWLAIAQSYPTRTPAEQKNIQSRMAEWAALPRSERENARLNFTETKRITPAQRSADWETYQKLGPEEKKALAEKAHPAHKPIGAAVPTKPASSPKLTPVPITRHTPAQEKAALQGTVKLNPHTLLPMQVPKQAPKQVPVQQPVGVVTQ